MKFIRRIGETRDHHRRHFDPSTVGEPGTLLEHFVGPSRGRHTVCHQ